MICLETPIEDTVYFESTKILIESNRFYEVGGHIILHIGDAGYRIMVKELTVCSFVINPQFVVPARSSSMEIKAVIEGNRMPEIHGVNVAPNNEMKSTHWSNSNVPKKTLNSKDIKKDSFE